MEQQNQRIARLAATLQPHQAAFVVSGENRKYLTGFSSSAGVLLITADATYFLIDFRYIEKARAVIRGCEVILQDKLGAQLLELLQRHDIREVLIETDYMTVSQQTRYAQLLDPVTVSTDAAFNHAILQQRRIKTEEEIEAIKAAQEMTDQTFSYVLEQIHPGKTEREIALDMEFYMRRLGAEAVSFDFIVVSGKNSSLPHGVPTNKVIEKGDFITMDFGAVVNGYHSDMTRTVAVGAVSDRQKLVYDTVLQAQLKSMEAIRAGVVCSEVDKIARDIIYSAGFEGCFGHGLGHSVGVEIHEEPRLSPACSDLLEPGMIMTVEPGIYLENQFGVRIEDMVVVTEKGYLNLTKSSKELIIL